MFDHYRPRDQESIACLSRTLPELHREIANASGLYEKIRDCIYLVDLVLVAVEMLGEVDFPVDDGLAFDREVIGRVERVCQHVHVLVREPGLFEPVSKSLDLVRLEETVQAVDYLPFEVAHWLVVGWGIKKTI